MNRIQQQYGIGLLELMLSMVIIAILTLMSIQYFGSSKMNTQTTKAIDEIQDIIGIASGFPNPYRQIQGGKSGDGTSGKPNLNNAVVMSGQLPQEYIIDSSTITTPWKKNSRIVTYMHIDSNQKLVLGINITSIPNWGCESIVDKMRPEIYGFGGLQAGNYRSVCQSTTGISSVNIYFLVNHNKNI